MTPQQLAVRAAIGRAVARLAAVPEPAAQGIADLLDLPHSVAPQWPWCADEALCAAAQLACYEAACETLLPALAQWGQLSNHGPVAAFAGQCVRNALTQLRELPLVSAGRANADAVVWHLLTAHQFKFAVAADARLGPLALASYAAALQVVVEVLGLPRLQPAPRVGEQSDLAAFALTATWQTAAAARMTPSDAESQR